MEEEELWKQFDRDNSGYVDFNEFIRSLRGGMNPFRRQLVDTVFNKFDMDANGTVDIYDIRVHFNPSSDGGSKSDYEIYREFLIGFGDTNRDGMVTRAEFQAYY